MGSVIRILPEEVINQIAAGEVIEHPAAAVKELVENAIDAHSRLITVEIKGGGFQLIRVSDDGIGMSQDDLMLCLERHATSKIRSAQDLFLVQSMGFRGEALASLAAISKLTLLSCLQGEAIGAQLYAEGGKLKRIEQAARQVGTTVEVSCLFYNTPARRKFQKSILVSQNAIMRLLIQLALAHPFVSIRYINDDREILSTLFERTGSHQEILKEVIQMTLGTPFLQSCFSVSHQKKDMNIQGYIGAPDQARLNRTEQYICVNQRPVLCSEISRAVSEGYGTSLGTHTYPAFVLHITLSPQMLDVNVHPQKKDIRLADSYSVQSFVREAIEKSLQGSIFPHSQEPFALSEKIPFELPYLDREIEKKLNLPAPFVLNKTCHTALPVIGLFASYLLIDGSALEGIFQGLNRGEDCSGLVMVDLKRAEARITYENVLEKLKEGKGELQELLFPVTISLTPHEINTSHLYLDQLQKMGIAIRHFGKDQILIEALDPTIEIDQIEFLIHQLLDVLRRVDDPRYLVREREKELALKIASWTQSKRTYTIEQGKEIVKCLLKTKAAYQSPKGELTVVQMSYRDIERYFHKKPKS